jgi:two-component sensor histidine kinase/methyl-accepting chemotaxis protein
MRNFLKYFENNKWYKGLLAKTAFLFLFLITMTLSIFIVGTLPHQLNVIEDRMKSEANDIASSIGQVTATAIINNDYGFTVDHCLKIIKQSNSILYIIIIRKDGFALIHTADGWRQETINNNDNPQYRNEGQGTFQFCKLVSQEVFHYSYSFSYSGIDWGRINVGLSLNNYNKNIEELYLRTFLLAISSIIVSFFASVFFVRKLTQPIRQLNNVAKKIAEGGLNARVNINSEDEIGKLAYSFNKMADSLQNSQDNLERKVEERTSELEATNEILQSEIKERLAAENTLKQYNSRLEAYDKIYRGIISARTADEIIKETLTQMPILYQFIDGAAAALIDLESAAVNVHIADFDPKDTTTFSTVKFPIDWDVIYSENNPLNKEYFVDDIRLLQNKFQIDEGMLMRGYLSYLAVPLLMDNNRIGNLIIAAKTTKCFNNANKEVLLVVANHLAVAVYQAQLQAKIKEHSQSLQNSLSEKEVLLKEIHHRVKNNLQVISSLLYLNSKKITDKNALYMFKESQNRVKSIALVHERLYQSKNLGRIDFKDYVQKLITDLFRSYAVNQSMIELDLDIKDISISIDLAVPCGLIINELISNSLKYAFPNYEDENKKGLIKINFNKNGNEELILKVSDNGIGITQSEIEEKKKNSLGLQLIETLVTQLEGSLEIDSNSGTSFIIKFKDDKTNG